MVAAVIIVVRVVVVVVVVVVVSVDEDEEEVHKGLPGRMSILEGAIFGGGHDKVFNGDLVELSEGLGLRHRRHVVQTKTETKLLQIGSLGVNRWRERRNI